MLPSITSKLILWQQWSESGMEGQQQGLLILRTCHLSGATLVEIPA